MIWKSVDREVPEYDRRVVVWDEKKGHVVAAYRTNVYGSSDLWLTDPGMWCVANVKWWMSVDDPEEDLLEES